MASAVFGVRAVTIGMLHSMTLYTGPSLRHTSHLVWSLQEFFRSDGKRPDGITVVPRPAQTHSQLRTFPVLPVVLERSQLQQKNERGESTLTSTRGIRSSRSPSRPQEFSVRRPWTSCGNWAVASSWRLLTATPSLT